MSAELVQLVRDQQERIVELERKLAVAEAVAVQPAPAANTDEAAPEYLTVKEAAELLGVCTDTIYAAVRQELIPGAIKIKGSIRLRRVELLNWGRGSTSATLPAQRQTRRARKQRRP